MGGQGSTRWAGHTKRWPADQCQQISVSDFSLRLLSERYHAGLPVSTADTWRGIHARLVIGASARLGQRFNVTRTACNFGGYRYWLACPECGRRVGKLYRPPDRVAFRCRICWQITYSSAQNAHEFDRAPGAIGALARRLDRAVKAEKLFEQMNAARIGSKRWQRLAARIDKLMSD